MCFTGLLVYWFTGMLVYCFTGLLVYSLLVLYPSEMFSCQNHKCCHSLVVIVADCCAKGQWFNPAHQKTEFACCGCGKLF